MSQASVPQPSIAVWAALFRPSGFAHKCLRAYQNEGWRVLPVHPAGGQVLGLNIARTLSELSGPVDRLSLYLPPPWTLEALPEIVASRPTTVWLNPGTADDAVRAEARRLGLPIIEACSIVAIGRSPAEYPDTG